MSEVEACVVMTTAPDATLAEKIARTVLEARLAACVQIQPITSFYWWDGRINSDAEHLIYLKTTADSYAALEQAIVKIHPYDTPEIIRLPIEQGLAKYLAWVAKETAG
jgi:periplasmic divalent cation tolerance protein